MNKLMKKIQFSKMNGLGNDFVVIDATRKKFNLSHKQINALGDRKTGIGFDQLLVVEPPQVAGVDFNYRIFNTDGGEVEHCGNGARCFAKFVKDKGLTNKQQLTVQVKKGLITTHYYDDNHIEVDMAQPILTPSAIPFNYSDDQYRPTYSLNFAGQHLDASVLSMGNPHIVLFVDNLWQQAIESLAKAIQQSAYFPQSVNVNFVEIIDDTHLELRTYERGVGETDACGTGACASAFVMHQRTASQPNPIHVKVRGGAIRIRLDNTLRIFMSGPARHVFDGEVIVFDE